MKDTNNKIKFNILEFNFGKQRRSLKEWIQIGAIFHLVLNAISLIPGLKKETVFNFLDKIQRRFNLEVINDYIIQDSELLNFRIQRIVSEVLEDYNEQMEIEQ
jgi:hypothetical protein